MRPSGARRALRAARAPLLAVLLAVVLAGAGSQQAAASTLWGLRGAGVLRNPTGDTGLPGQFTLGVHTFGGQSYSFVRYQLTEDLELGLVTENAGFLGVGPLVSFRLRHERGALPALSVGLQYREAFVVASRAVGDPWTRAHLGLRVGLEEAGGSTAPPLRMFAGFGRVLNPVAVRRPGQPGMPILAAGVEFDGQYLNAALTAQVGRHVQVDVGVQDRGALRLAGGVSITRQF